MTIDVGIEEFSSPLFIDLTSIRDGVRIVVGGEIDLATAPQLQASMTEAVSAHRTVEVDMTDVDFMDSTGLRALIVAKEAQVPGHTFAITAASPCVLRLLGTVGLEEHFGLRANQVPGDDQLEDEAGRLTNAQERVLGLLCEGLSNREIADLLFLSPDTIKSHLTTIYRKLGVTSRAEAIVTTLQTRWTLPSD